MNTLENSPPLRDITLQNTGSSATTINISARRLRKKRNAVAVTGPGEARFNGVFVDMVYRVITAQMTIPKSQDTNPPSITMQVQCESYVTTCVGFVGMYLKHLVRKGKPFGYCEIYAADSDSLLRKYEE
jgi:hypothetical protein